MLVFQQVDATVTWVIRGHCLRVHNVLNANSVVVFSSYNAALARESSNGFNEFEVADPRVGTSFAPWRKFNPIQKDTFRVVGSFSAIVTIA
jgi:hypothetical protein